MFGFGKKSGPVLGLDINSSTISVIELTKAKNDTSVSRFQSIPTPPDIVREGLLADPEAVGNSVKELLDMVGVNTKKPTAIVNIGIPGQAVVIRLMPVPTGMPPDELSDVIRQEAINNLPFPLEEANIDYCLLPATERTDPDGVRRVDVLLAAIQRIVVDSYWRMAETANIKLGRLDISSLAVIRSLAAAGMLKDDGMLPMTVNIRNDATDITLTKKGMPLFSRSVLLGVETLGEAISRSIDVPMDEAVSLLPKINLGSVPTTDPKLGQAAQVARSVFGDLIAEVGRSLEFYMSQVGIIQVDQVLVTGPGCVVPGIDEFVSNRLNIPTSIADPFANLSYDAAVIEEQRRPTHAMLVGLVTDPNAVATQTVEIDLNKQDRAIETSGEPGEEGEAEEAEEEVDTPWFVPALGVGVVAAVVSLGFWGVMAYMLSQASTEYDDVDQKVTQQKSEVDRMRKSQDELITLKQKKEVLERVVHHGTPVTGMLEIARAAIPQGVQIATLTVSPAQMKSLCISLDFARAAHYGINLSGTHMVDDVKIKDVHRAKSHPRMVFFNIEAAVKPEVGNLPMDQDAITKPPKTPPLANLDTPASQIEPQPVASGSPTK